MKKLNGSVISELRILRHKLVSVWRALKKKRPDHQIEVLNKIYDELLLSYHNLASEYLAPFYIKKSYSGRNFSTVPNYAEIACLEIKKMHLMNRVYKEIEKINEKMRPGYKIDFKDVYRKPFLYVDRANAAKKYEEISEKLLRLSQLGKTPRITQIRFDFMRQKAM